MRCRALPLALLLVPGLARADDITVDTSTPGVLGFKVGTETVARYHTAPGVAKPYLWPVLAPGGTPVTRTWPIEKNAPGDATTDHPHQKSAWFCHGDVIPEGLDLKTKSANKADHGVDFWSEARDKDGKPRHGTIKVVQTKVPVGPSAGPTTVVTENEWITPDGVKILDEVRTITAHNLPAGRLFVFECRLAANDYPITFGDTKEGSFGVRVHDALRTVLPTGGTVTAADGTAVSAPAKDNLPVWGKPSDWHDYSGTVDGKAVGLAVFDHPKNPSRAYWHTRAYGLMAANPFGRDHSGFPGQKGKTDLVKIAKGKSLTFKYAVYAHTGDAKAGKVAEAYEVFKK